MALAYEEAGRGYPPLVFVAGWTCDRSFFAQQVEHFGRRHRVLALDLRGHGESDKPPQDYTFAGHAADVAWVCGQLAVERPVIVGHSIAGCVALELASRGPPLPAAIVMIEAPILASPDRRSGIMKRVQAMRDGDLETAHRLYSEAYVLPFDDEQRMARIVERMVSSPAHVAASEIEQLFNWDAEAAATACAVPALFINAALPRPELARFRELCPHLLIAQTAGAGHFNMLEVPNQVNAMIERFLAIAIPGHAR